jgi:hypothetical protein
VNNGVACRRKKSASTIFGKRPAKLDMQPARPASAFDKCGVPGATGIKIADSQPFLVQQQRPANYYKPMNLPSQAVASPLSAFERLLVPGSAELPICRCGKEMQIASLDPLPERSDVHIRIYNCRTCHHEMRLTVWPSNDTPAQ